MLSKINKPYGVCVALRQEHFLSYFAKSPVDTIPFISKGRVKRLGLHIKTVEDFVLRPHEDIKKLMGGHGLKLYYELNDINAWSPNVSQKPHNI